MSRLFESFEKLEAGAPYRRYSPRASFLYAIMSAFLAGAQMVIIMDIFRARRPGADLWFEILFLALWVACGVRWGRTAWERVNR